MASFFGISDSFFGTDTTSYGNSNMLGDYAMIKNGAYKKLLNAYYAKQSNETEETEDSKETKSEKTKLLQTQSRADVLKKAADELRDSDLFKGTEDSETGKVTYDREAITKKLSAFVDSYNDLLESAGDVDTKNVLSKTLRMISNTQANSGLLEKAGISIGKDNKLVLDKDKVKEADMNVLKTLFSGRGSLADKVSQKANETSRLAKQATITSIGKSYTDQGSYTDITGSTLYDELF